MSNFTHLITSTIMDANTTSSNNTAPTVAQILGYQPSSSAAIIFCILFLSISAIILLLTIRTRCWFMLTAVLTGVMCAGGFYCRYLVSNMEHISIGPFVGNILLILVAPNGLAIVNYTVLGRIIAFHPGMNDKHNRQTTYWRIPILMDSYGYIIPTRITKVFVLSDIIAFVLQTAGGIMSGDENPDTAERGRNIVIIGIVIQFVFVGLFILLGIRVYVIHRSYIAQHNQHIELVNDTQYSLQSLSWVFASLSLTMLLFIGRNLYRIFEFTTDSVSHTEAYFYIGDTTLVFGIFIIFTIFHFGFWLPSEQVKKIQVDHKRLRTSSEELEIEIR